MPAGRMMATEAVPPRTSVSARARSIATRAVSCSPIAVVIVRRLLSADSAATSARLFSVCDSSTTITGSRPVPPDPSRPPKITAKIEKKATGSTNTMTWAARSRLRLVHETRVSSGIIRAAPFR